MADLLGIRGDRCHAFFRLTSPILPAEQVPFFFDLPLRSCVWFSHLLGRCFASPIVPFVPQARGRDPSRCPDRERSY